MIMLLLDIFAWLFVLYVVIVFIIASLATIYEISSELFELALNILNKSTKLTFELLKFFTLKNLNTIVRSFFDCIWLFFKQIVSNFAWKRLS